MGRALPIGISSQATSRKYIHEDCEHSARSKNGSDSNRYPTKNLPLALSEPYPEPRKAYGDCPLNKDKDRRAEVYLPCHGFTACPRHLFHNDTILDATDNAVRREWDNLGTLRDGLHIVGDDALSAMASIKMHG
jgi:hypothetical protein